MSADKRQLNSIMPSWQAIDEVRRMQHDILHHLRVMSGYAQAGDYDRLKEYLDALVEQMPDMDGGVLLRGPCGQYSFLKYYGEQARNGGSGSIATPRFLLTCPVLPWICARCWAMPCRTPWRHANARAVEPDGISLLARLVGHNLIMEIRNSYDGRVKWDGDRLSYPKGGKRTRTGTGQYPACGGALPRLLCGQPHR